MTELAESLVERGVEVTALAGKGRYNGGEQLPSREDYRGIRIERAWATSFGKRSLGGRLSDYLSFYVGAFLRLCRIPRHNIIMVLTTPPLIGLVALIVGRLRRMHVISLVQDVYPDVAIALGALRPQSLAASIAHRLNKMILRRSDRVIVLGECMRERIVDKLEGDSGHVDVIHNWADGEKIKPLDRIENEFIREHHLEDKFTLLFSGNFGRVNEFATILEAARILRERSDIIFLFIGDGAKSGEITGFIRKHHLSNILILPYQSREKLSHSLTAGDAAFVTLADGLAGLSVPSKTYAMLAAGKPLLFIGDIKSEAASLVKENSCGVAIPAGESATLARVIKQLFLQRDRIEEMGRAARVLFEKRFDRRHAVNAYLQSFEMCLDKARTGDRVQIPKLKETSS